MAQRVKHLPAIRETLVQFLGREDPLEKEMATHSSILAWEYRGPWRATLHGVARVGHDLVTKPPISYRKYIRKTDNVVAKSKVEKFL